MKKIIISCMAILIFTYYGCNKDSIVAPVVTHNQILKLPDSAKIVQQLPDTSFYQDTSNSVKGKVLFEFKDIDGNVYHAILIGSQTWSRENLKTTHYNDGTPIPLVLGTSDWETLKTGAYCCYNYYDASNSNRYGLLYNYFAVASNKLAPKGWHVARNAEWDLLSSEAGLEKPVGFDVGALVEATDWREPFYLRTRKWGETIPILCTNSTGFTALPNGYRDNAISPDYPEFDCLGYQASWWTSNGTIMYLDGWFGIFSRNDRPVYVGSGVRLVKDAE